MRQEEKWDKKFWNFCIILRADRVHHHPDKVVATSIKFWWSRKKVRNHICCIRSYIYNKSHIYLDATLTSNSKISSKALVSFQIRYIDYNVQLVRWNQCTGFTSKAVNLAGKLIPAKNSLWALEVYEGVG